MRRALAAAVLCALAAPAAAQQPTGVGKSFNQLPVAGSVTGGDILPLMQNGVTKQITLSGLQSLFNKVPGPFSAAGAVTGGTGNGGVSFVVPNNSAIRCGGAAPTCYFDYGLDGTDGASLLFRSMIGGSLTQTAQLLPGGKLTSRYNTLDDGKGTMILGGPGQMVDAYTAPPAHLTALSGAGSYVSVSPKNGHVPGDTFRSALALLHDTVKGPEAQEELDFVELHSRTGAVNGYVNGTAYAVGDYVHDRLNTATYVVTQAGTTAATGSGPAFCPVVANNANQCASGYTNASTGTDGGVTFQWYTAGINDGKTARGTSVSRDPGGGNVWGHATNMVINWLPVGSSTNYNHELDITNNGRNCPAYVAGGCAVYGLSMIAAGAYVGTIGYNGDSIGGGFNLGLRLGPNFGRTAGIVEETSALTGTINRGTNTYASVSNTATAPIGQQLAGTYSGAAIDTTGAATPSALVAKAGQNICLNGAGSWCLSYQSGSGAVSLNGPGGQLWYVDGASGQHAPAYYENLATPTSSSAPCNAGQFGDDANYHYVCTAANTWKRVALSIF